MHKLKPIRILAGLSAVLLALSLLPHQPLLAAPSATTTFTVNTTDDRLDDDTGDGDCLTSVGTCALRAAIMQANHLSGPGVVTIILPAGTYTLTRPIVTTDGEDSGDLNLTPPLSANQLISLVGAGAAVTIIEANQIDRVMTVEAGRVASLSGVTLRHGYTPDSGGGLANMGTLAIMHSTITDNEAEDQGGGLFNTHSLTLDNSTISLNRAENGGGVINSAASTALTITTSTISQNHALAGSGGGLYNGAASRLTIVASTFSHNTATGNGGAVANTGSSLFVIESTFSQNKADGSGGGFYNDGTVNVYNSTIVYNGADAEAGSSGEGGGIFNHYPAAGNANGPAFNNAAVIFNIRNSLVAGNNELNSPVQDDCTGTVGQYGVNLIGVSMAGAAGCTVIGPGTWAYLNTFAYLGDLQNNGGPTFTHALLRGSNAIDGGNINPPMSCVDDASVPLLTDQRGATRVVGTYCDIGAFEYRPPLYLPLNVR